MHSEWKGDMKYDEDGDAFRIRSKDCESIWMKVRMGGVRQSGLSSYLSSYVIDLWRRGVMSSWANVNVKRYRVFTTFQV